MAQVILTFKLMGDSPEADLSKVKEEADKLVTEFDGEVGKSEEQPVAFGIKALFLYVVRDESLGSTEELEEKLAEIEGVQSCECTDCRRAVG